MKKKYLNLLIIFVLTLTIGVRNVNAYGVSRELHNFWNDYGIPNLYYKKLMILKHFVVILKKMLQLLVEMGI